MQTLVVADPLADLARLEGVPSAVAAALDAVDVVLRDRGLRALPPEAVAGARVVGARGSAALTEDPERWLPGAVRVAAELPTLAATLRLAPAQALARVHLLVARGSVPPEQLGRLATTAGTTERMAGLQDLLMAPTSVSAVILGAVVHGELATAAPFGSADGLVARAAEHLVLVGGGVDPLAVVPVEAGHAESPAAYRAAVAGYRGGTLAGVRSWLLHCAAALSRGAELSAVGPARRSRTGRSDGGATDARA